MVWLIFPTVENSLRGTQGFSIVLLLDRRIQIRIPTNIAPDLDPGGPNTDSRDPRGFGTLHVSHGFCLAVSYPAYVLGERSLPLDQMCLMVSTCTVSYPAYVSEDMISSS